MREFSDPQSGRSYEIGPDGQSRWLDQGTPTTGRPWYRKVRYMAPLGALGGFALAAAGNSAQPTTTTAAAAPSATTVTNTATVTVSPTGQPAPPAAVTRTVTVAPRSVRVTVTRTRTTTVEALAGSSGGGSGNAAVYYANCTQARAAGDTPLYVGDPGYRPALDRDGDGIACE